MSSSLHHPFQLRERPLRRAVHGEAGGSQGLGDLAYAEPLVVPQGDHLALGFVKPGYQVGQAHFVDGPFRAGSGTPSSSSTHAARRARWKSAHAWRATV